MLSLTRPRRFNLALPSLYSRQDLTVRRANAANGLYARIPGQTRIHISRQVLRAQGGRRRSPGPPNWFTSMARLGMVPWLLLVVACRPPSGASAGCWNKAEELHKTNHLDLMNIDRSVNWKDGTIPQFGRSGRGLLTRIQLRQTFATRAEVRVGVYNAPSELGNRLGQSGE